MSERQVPERKDDRAGCRRVLLYSHDTYGLGHLRRARAIANALAAGGGIRALILSGSPVAESYAFAAGVESVRIPAVTKRGDAAYASVDPGVPLERTVEARARIIARSVESFAPDLIVVDKEPTGFQGEMLPVLLRARERGCRLVLGLRDVLDEPGRLAAEWRRKGAFAALPLYDEIWIYGVPRLYEPLAGLPVPEETARRVLYTGYLRRDLSGDSRDDMPAPMEKPFLLVTPGGGGDGDGLVDRVIAAYEADPGIPLPALIAFGPFMSPDSRAGFLDRIGRMPGRLAGHDFDSAIERVMARAAGIVAMGGYNTFCEILSFDKRALLVPRTAPRREQAIRARAAQSLGLARTLPQDGAPAMAAALRALPDQPPPSRIVVPGLLDGLDVLARRVDALLGPSEEVRDLRAACL